MFQSLLLGNRRTDDVHDLQNKASPFFLHHKEFQINICRLGILYIRIPELN